MDWSKAKPIKKSNSVISSIRSTTEDEPVKVKSKPIKKVKGFANREDETIVLYPKVYQGCGECGTEAIHFIKLGNVTCRSCGCSYSILPYKGTTVIKNIEIIDYNKFLFL